MARGRIAKPTSLKALQGNAGHRHDDRGDEPAPPPGAPEAPDWLGDVARRKWFEICALMLHVPGWLTTLDGDVLALYCAAWARLVEAETDIPRLKKKLPRAKRDARGQILNEINLLTGQRKQADKEMKTTRAELGLSPAARTRIRVNPGQGELPLGAAAEETPFSRAQRLAQGVSA